MRARRRWQRHPVSVTFDDDAPDHTAHALPALREHGVRASFLPDGLVDAARRRGLLVARPPARGRRRPGPGRARAVSRARTRSRACARRSATPRPRGCGSWPARSPWAMTEDQVAELVQRRPGHRLPHPPPLRAAGARRRRARRPRWSELRAQRSRPWRAPADPVRLPARGLRRPRGEAVRAMGSTWRHRRRSAVTPGATRCDSAGSRSRARPWASSSSRWCAGC